MSTKNKNIASQALLEMDAITSAIKEESKKSMKSLLSEAVKTALRESCDEEDDKDYEVQDENEEEKNTSDNKEKDSSEKGSTNEIGNPEMGGEEEPGNEAINQPNQPEPQMNGAQGAPAESPEMAQENPEASMEGGDEGWDEFSDYFRQNSTSLGEFQKIVSICQEKPFYFVIVTHPLSSLAKSYDSSDKTNPWSVVQQRFEKVEITLKY